jgi:hypothetical protein
VLHPIYVDTIDSTTTSTPSDTHPFRANMDRVSDCATVGAKRVGPVLVGPECYQRI